MHGEEFRLTGWLAIIMAVIETPRFVLGHLSEWQILYTFLVVASAILFVYVYQRFKDLLHSRYDFYEVDVYITIFIWLAVIGAVLSLIIPSPWRSLGTSYVGWGIILAIAYAILVIVFNVKLLKISDPKASELRPYAYLGIASSICLVTIIGALVVPLLSSIQDFILGMIFLRAAETF